MATPTAIVAYLALFGGTAAIFLFVNLLLGRILRPKLPNEEKLEVYECGEPVIGSSFVQFDLRFYVVALLFIIFDVEVAFFFPWATVFGKATQLTAENMPIVAVETTGNQTVGALTAEAAMRFRELGAEPIVIGGEAEVRAAASQLAATSFADIAVFFAVLLVGFAYVWKRGDLDWVRATTSQAGEVVERAPPRSPAPVVRPGASVLSA